MNDKAKEMTGNLNEIRETYAAVICLEVGFDRMCEFTQAINTVKRYVKSFSEEVEAHVEV